uniref:Uncharacterized protein n=1 Tax=Kalanchoe fedtschenkoi TaxID=63787 RepID=A0A7N0UKC1_KALFE
MGLFHGAFCLLLAVFFAQPPSSLSSNVYVVYMGTPGSHDPDGIPGLHHQMLASVHHGSLELARESHVYSYKHAFRGFAARLSEQQASDIAKMPGVVSVFPNSKNLLQTTHSWDFMGLRGEATMEIPGHSTENQHNVIIGFIDTGIWPESPSFSDHGMPPVPAGWRGICQAGEAFNASSCNRKIIGARYYLSGYLAEEGPSTSVTFRSPRDGKGHGSHTASTAAGRYVKNMSNRGLAAGGARGGAPMARIAVYKTCWEYGCYDVDLLAAFDDAIRDGVHILSVSLGSESQGEYFRDAISLGSFHAASHGIVVVSSAGNEGNPGSVTNLAPWMITVAASSTDRDFTSNIILGTGLNFTGESLSLSQLNVSTAIMSASEANGGNFLPYQSSLCLESSLDNTKAKGKVLVCQHAEGAQESMLAKSKVVKEAGGVGMILINEEGKDIGIPFVLPAAIVGRKSGDRILSYINHTHNPRTRISSATTVLRSRPAPRISVFSSKGPNSLTPEILKPDIAAPGLNILAAWSPAVGNMEFNIISGTSMACPHVTGIAALIKSVYPTWSPSAIKSAIMTTAVVLDKNRKHITADPSGRRAIPFDYGAGFVNPIRVLDPGLIYDAHPQDYKAFLCSIGYDDKMLRMITRDNSTCSQSRMNPSGLNYPSITVPSLQDNFSVTRTVTNVGKPRSIYRAAISSPAGTNVSVVPQYLIFSSYGQKINFTVNFKVTALSKGYAFGSLSWKNRESRVTVPLVVRAEASSMGLMR